MPERPGAITLSYGDDLVASAAAYIIQHFARQLPDLGSLVVIMPRGHARRALRRQLLTAAHDHQALLGPTLSGLREWIDHSLPDPQAGISPAAAELMLVDALDGHRQLFAGADPWRVAESLLPLFADLSRRHQPLPNDPEAFTRLLQSAYGITGDTPQALSREAQLIHRLWLAWHEQLAGEDLADGEFIYQRKLQQHLKTCPPEQQFLLLGVEHFSAAELNWLQELARRGQLHCLLPCGSPATPDSERLHPDGPPQALLHSLPLTGPATPSGDARSRCLDRVFAAQPTLLERARLQRDDSPQSPLHPDITIHASDSAEQEARAIDLQTRRWLLAGHRDIGIVTEDRRLARRVRALLERAGIALQDEAGWALSTSSAAAALERWLEAVEEDFDHRPLLDVLKSPFVQLSPAHDTHDHEHHLEDVYRLERDIILHENIARGLTRYRRALAYRQQRLPEGPGDRAQRLFTLLDRIEQAAAPLVTLLQDRHPASDYLHALRDSLHLLGMWSRLESDPAGAQCLQLWHTLDSAARHTPIDLTWRDFRTWLGRHLEQHSFQPRTAGGPVRLLNLQQSALCRFDGLIIGACDSEHLPGSPAQAPFFNQGVRRELGLDSWRDNLALRLHRFRALLQAAPRVLLTRQLADAGEPRLPSPWLEALQTFHQLAYGDGLEDAVLAQLLAHPGSQVTCPLPAPPPPLSTRPAPQLPAALTPARLSASSHQRLLDCPYQFFAADGLALRPTEAVKEALEKSDFGQRVHLCLEAFHAGARDLPGPFRAAITDDNRAQAATLLEDIARRVFARDLEDNFLHRGWLQRWLQLIPDYLRWQQRREQHWRTAAAEQLGEQHLAPGLSLYGRLDRIDQQGEQCAILDYKTGTAPRQDAVDQGEAVQLPSYALLLDTPVDSVGYLLLDQGKVKDGASLQGDDLHTLKEDVRQRLIAVMAAITAGAALPAWGDPGTCRYCDMDGLCRRQAWDAAETGAAGMDTPVQEQ